MHCSSLTLKLAFQGQGSDLQWCFLTAKKVNWPGILTCFLWVIWFDASHVGWLLTHQDCHQIVQTCLELCSCLENNKIPNKNSRPITKMHDLQSVLFLPFYVQDLLFLAFSKTAFLSLETLLMWCSLCCYTLPGPWKTIKEVICNWKFSIFIYTKKKYRVMMSHKDSGMR